MAGESPLIPNLAGLEPHLQSEDAKHAVKLAKFATSREELRMLFESEAQRIQKEAKEGVERAEAGLD